MEWTINGQIPEALGVELANISEQTLDVSELVLNVVQQSYDVAAPLGLNYGDIVLLELDGEQVFIGRVRQAPRSASSDRESFGYTIKDVFEDLGRVVYLEERESVKSINI